MYLATEPAHEVESGLVDLELARAVPRHRLLTRSLLLALAVAARAPRCVMAAGTWLGARLFDAGGLDLPSPAVRAAPAGEPGRRWRACFGGLRAARRDAVAPLDDGVHDRRCSTAVVALHDRFPRDRLAADARRSRGSRRSTTIRRCRSSPVTRRPARDLTVLFGAAACSSLGLLAVPAPGSVARRALIGAAVDAVEVAPVAAFRGRSVHRPRRALIGPSSSGSK